MITTFTFLSTTSVLSQNFKTAILDSKAIKLRYILSPAIGTAATASAAAGSNSGVTSAYFAWPLNRNPLKVPLAAKGIDLAYKTWVSEYDYFIGCLSVG